MRRPDTSGPCYHGTRRERADALVREIRKASPRECAKAGLIVAAYPGGMPERARFLDPIIDRIDPPTRRETP